jgi:hypothetical protein
VGASLFLILGYTVFAYQYAMSWQDAATFYYAGSPSDAVILFAIFFFLIAVMTIFGKTLENMLTIRPMAIKYEIITKIILIISLFIAITLIATIAITLTGRVFLFFLNPIDAMIGLQTVGIGLLIGFGLIGLVFGTISYYLARIVYRPLEHLEEETAAVTEPGVISFQEPAGLVFTELQGISDNFKSVLLELGRVRAELRRFSVIDRHPRTPSTTQLAKLDYYLAILNNTMTNRIQSIMTLTEIGQGTSNPDERMHIFTSIQSEIDEIRFLLRSVQLLRLIDIQALPEFQRINLSSVITKIINELHTLFPESASQLSLSLPDKEVFVLANEYVSQIFQPLFRIVLEQAVGGPATIDVTFEEVKELGIEYWQVDISHPKWVLPDIEKVLLFREDAEQPQKANPRLLVIPALVKHYRGQFQVTNIVIDDPQYGTRLQVLLPKAKQSRRRRPRRAVDESGAE